MSEYYNFSQDTFVFKEICDYIEEIINDDSYNRDFYKYSPFIDNLLFIIKKIFNGRILSMFKNFFSRNESQKIVVDAIDYDKVNKLKKIVDEINSK